MITVPSELQCRFENMMREKGVPDRLRRQYKKLLRYYYLDFCQKYSFLCEQTDSLPLFLGKLQEKKQTAVQQEQASSAIHLYYKTVDICAYRPKQQGISDSQQPHRCGVNPPAKLPNCAFSLNR